MSFLFGKKKGGPQPSAPAPRDGRPPGGPPGGPNNAAPPVNGIRDQEKAALVPQKPIGPTGPTGPTGPIGPNGYGNNAAGANSTSPDHGSRGGSQQDNHVRILAFTDLDLSCSGNLRQL